MSFLEVIPPFHHHLHHTHKHVHLYGPGEGGRDEGRGVNRELGNQIYWHFFKGDSWWEERGKVRKSVSPIHLPAGVSSERLAVFRLH